MFHQIPRKKSHFSFLLFDDEVTKFYVISVYILQGKMSKTEKNGKKIIQLKWPKCQEPKVETWDEQNIR